VPGWQINLSKAQLMRTYTLYIGSDNATTELELTKIERILSRRHKGFTIAQATGYWLGKRERTAVVTLHDEPAKVMATIEDLKTELHQDAIAYQMAPSLQFLQGNEQTANFQTLVGLAAANIDNHKRRSFRKSHPNRSYRTTRKGTQREALAGITIMLLCVIVAFLMWAYYISE